MYGSDETNGMIVQVLIRIGSPAVTLLNEMMKNLSDQIRYEIIDALGDIGEDDDNWQAVNFGGSNSIDKATDAYDLLKNKEENFMAIAIDFLNWFFFVLTIISKG